MKQYNFVFLVIVFAWSLSSCSHGQNSNDVSPEQAAKIDRKLVRDAVVFEQGTKDGAIVPELSAPRLRAVWVAEKVENNRLIEAHREWILEGEINILGIPSVPTENKKRKK